MNIAAQVLVVVAGLLHVLIFAMESVLFRQPKVHGRFFVRADEVASVRPWALNQGFYNLFLALGALGGVVAVHVADRATAGAAIALFSVACMLGAALVLLVTDRRMARAAVMQGTAPLLALVCAAVL
ncbi:DUF1304 domain-containing protein [Longispora urticae]